MKSIVVFVVALFAGSAVAGDAQIRRYEKKVPNQYIVKFADGEEGPKARALASALARQHGARVQYVFERIVPGAVMEMPERAAEAMLRHPAVEYIEEDGIVELSVGNPQSPAPDHLDRIDQRSLPLNDSYNFACITGNKTIAYVVDSGIRATHQEFRDPATGGSRVITGVDFVSGGEPGNSLNPCFSTDLNHSSEYCAGECLGGGHGTAVASVLAGEFYGVAKDIKLISVRTQNCVGNGEVSRMARGLEWIYNDFPRRNAPAIMNMSNSMRSSAGCQGSYCVSTIENWIRRLVTDSTHQIPVIVAAHNTNEDVAEKWSPARLGDDLDGVITVGGTQIVDNSSDWRWICDPANPFEICDSGNSGSNYGAAVDVFAVAQNVSAAGMRCFDGWSWYTCDTAERSTHRSGTSFSTPAVAGVAARILFKTTDGRSTLTAANVETQIKNDSTKTLLDGQTPVIYDARSESRLLYREGPSRCRAY